MNEEYDMFYVVYGGRCAEYSDVLNALYFALLHQGTLVYFDDLINNWAIIENIQGWRL